MLRLPNLILLICAALLTACASTTEEAKPYDGPLVWPQPPDQPRFAYEAILRSAADVTILTEDQRLREALTGQPAVSRDPVFDKPSAVVARHGRVYVADSSSHSIMAFDLPRRRLFRFGTREPNNVEKPAGLALDNDMNVYVADSKLRKVLVFDSLGLYLRSIGDPNDLERPTGVGVSRDGERIYVVDRSYNETENHRVVVYDKAGKKLQVIGSRGAADGQFNVPLQATVAADGTLYVLDSGNFRVQSFDKDGKFLHSFGGVGNDFGKFGRPRGIAVDDEGNIYVTDASFNNFQIFNPKGQLLLAIGQIGMESHPGVFAMINGISVDETGRIYVADQFFNKIEVYRKLSDAEGKQMLKDHKK